MVTFPAPGRMITGVSASVRDRMEARSAARRRATVGSTPPQPVDVTVRLSSALVDEVSAMAQTHQVSVAQAMRDALAIGVYVDQQRRKGRKIIIRRPGGGDYLMNVTPASPDLIRGRK